MSFLSTVHRTVKISVLLAIFLFSHAYAEADARTSIPLSIGIFHLVKPVQAFSPSNLEDHIDGQAPSVERYEFNECAYGIYAPRGKGSNTITVDIYQMATPLDSFGYYSYQLSPSAKAARYVSVGAGGYTLSGGLSFWKGVYYVNVNIAAANASSFQAAQLTIARAISARLSGSSSMPALLKNLPPGYTPHSQKYQRRDVAAERFLENGVSASYPAAGQQAELFICKYGSPSSAKSAYSRYIFAINKPFTLAAGARVILLKGVGAGAFAVKTRFSGYVLAALKGSFLVGIHKAANQVSALKLVRVALARVH